MRRVQNGHRARRAPPRRSARRARRRLRPRGVQRTVPSVAYSPTSAGRFGRVGSADVPTVAPYGSWSSPITLDLVANEGGVAYGYVAVDGDGVYWLESRPQGGGRQALVFLPHGGSAADVVPAGFNVRTRVHEYGGGAGFRDGAVVYCSNFDDSRLYRIDEPGSEPRPITPAPKEPHAWRYADGRVFA